VTVAQVYRQWTSFPATNDQILTSILVQIPPGNTWTGLAEFAWQERLTGEIVVGLLVMAMGEQFTHVAKQG
jgi:hypothetical protein